MLLMSAVEPASLATDVEYRAAARTRCRVRDTGRTPETNWRAKLLLTRCASAHKGHSSTPLVLPAVPSCLNAPICSSVESFEAAIAELIVLDGLIERARVGIGQIDVQRVLRAGRVHRGQGDRLRVAGVGEAGELEYSVAGGILGLLRAGRIHAIVGRVGARRGAVEATPVLAPKPNASPVPPTVFIRKLVPLALSILTLPVPSSTAVMPAALKAALAENAAC